MDALERTATVDPSSDRWSDGFLQSAAAVLGQDGKTAQSVAAAPWIRGLLKNVVSRLNAVDQGTGEPVLSAKHYTAGLSIFASLSAVLSARPLVFESFSALGGAAEAALRNKAAAVSEYNAALGTLHTHTFVVLCRCNGYDLSGHELVSFVDGDVTMAVRILVALLKVPTYEGRLRWAAYRCLNDLSCPKSYFEAGTSVPDSNGLPRPIDAIPGAAKAKIAEQHTTREFVGHVNVLQDILIRTSGVAAALEDLSTWLGRAVARATDGPVMSQSTDEMGTRVGEVWWVLRSAALFSRMMRNVASFASDEHRAVEFQQQVGATPAMAKNLGQLVAGALDTLSDDVGSGSNVDTAFKATEAAASAALADSVGSLLLLAATVGFGSHAAAGVRRGLEAYVPPKGTKPAAPAAIVRLLKQPQGWFEACQRRRDAVLPALFGFLINTDLLADKAFSEAKAPNLVADALRSFAIATPTIGHAAWRRVHRVTSRVDAATESYLLADGWLNDLNEDRLDAVTAALDAQTAALEAEAAALTDAKAELVDAARGDAAASAVAGVADKAMLKSARTAETKSSVKEVTASALSEAKKFETPKKGDCVGSFPALQGGASPAKTKTAPLASKTGAPSVQFVVPPPDKKAPKHLCCALNGHLMQHPVTLASGRSFELATLQRVVERVGHIDPISSEPFSCDLVVDKKLQDEIREYKLTGARRAASAATSHKTTPAVVPAKPDAPAPQPKPVELPSAMRQVEKDPALYAEEDDDYWF